MTEPEPRVRPSSPALLITAGLAAGVLGGVLFERFYGSLPSLSILQAVTLLILAVIEGMTAITTRRRIERKPGSVPMNPLAVARIVLLAKASAAAGAIFTGLFLGAFVWLLPNRDTLAHAASDFIPAGAAAGASALLLAAALWLEHSCRIPKRPDDENDRTGDDREIPSDRA